MFTLARFEIALTGLALIIIVTQGGALIRHSEAAPNNRSTPGFYKAHFQCSAQDTTHFNSRFLPRVLIEHVPNAWNCGTKNEVLIETCAIIFPPDKNPEM